MQFKMRILLTAILLHAFTLTFAQDRWTKTKKECIPSDLTSTKLLVQKFKTRKLDDAPPQAFKDKNKRDEHPLIKKTNDKLSEYNEEVRAIWKNYAFDYAVVSKKKTEDTLKYPMADAKYILRNEVYMRKFQKNGQTDFFYTYVYYFHDRAENKDYPYIYLCLLYTSPSPRDA